jgi:single-strand DNA-binding protein
MSDYSHFAFQGNLGRDPEMRYTPSGQAVASFSVASNRKYKNAGGENVKETTWYRCSAWGKTAETCNQYLKKGSKVIVTGRLTPDKATGGPKVFTKQDGKASASFDVNVESVTFISGTKTTDEQPTGTEYAPDELDAPDPFF